MGKMCPNCGNILSDQAKFCPKCGTKQETQTRQEGKFCLFCGVSFDEFRDSFVSMLSDLDATNQDFADNFEKYPQK